MYLRTFRQESLDLLSLRNVSGVGKTGKFKWSCHQVTYNVTPSAMQNWVVRMKMGSCGLVLLQFPSFRVLLRCSVFPCSVLFQEKYVDF